MDSEKKIKDVLQENDFLTNQNSNFRSYCQEVADFVLPRKGWHTSIRAKGERIKFNYLYDTTAGGAVRDAAAGMQTHHSNPMSRWFGIEFKNKELMARHDIKIFCNDVVDWLLAKLSECGFYDVDLENKTNLLTFGNGTYGVFEGSKRLVYFKELPSSKVNRVFDYWGDLIKIYYPYKMTAIQAFKEFRQNAGKSILEKLEKEPFEEFDFVHYVGERFERDVAKKDGANMPFESLWINVKDKHIAASGGFESMPYITSAFYQDTDDPNGFSPAMEVLPEIKVLNAMMRTLIRGGMKVVDPPFVIPRQGFIMPLNWNPGRANYREAKTPNDALQILQTGGRIEIGVELIQMFRESIKSRMFVNLFNSLNEVTKQMTVLETQQRLAQSMGILGPVVNRLNDAASKMIIRLIDIGARNPFSGFPEVPEGLQDQSYEFVFLSPLAKAQRQSEVTEIQSFFGDVQGIAAVLPGAADKIDEDKTIDVLHRIRGITPEILRSDEDLERMRKHRQEQEGLMHAMQLGGGAANIAKMSAEAGAKEREMVNAR